MRTIAFVCILFLVIFSCSKTKDLEIIDCSDSLPPAPLDFTGSICQSDTCSTYLGIWKELFLATNKMTEEYFSKHITVYNVATYKYANQGIQFELSYKLSIDWFEAQFNEGFMIWLFPSYLLSNPTINLPGNVLLSSDQIRVNINNPYFGYAIHKISSIDHLNYSTRQGAIRTLAYAGGVNNFCASSLNIQYQSTKDIPAGHPILTASAALNWEENKCISGTMDLASEYLSVKRSYCMISFCFTPGTFIAQKGNQVKPIERIQIDDTILSVDQQTMNVETDIVKQVDSVRHNDIVHISFSDGTLNNNTFDHPYFVKSKGWSSYKPLLSQQNYNIKTKQLLVGDTCFKFRDSKLTEVLVKSIKENIGEVMTYNITRLEKNKTYFANGLLVSNESK